MCVPMHVEVRSWHWVTLSISPIFVDEGRVSLWTCSLPVPLNSMASLLWKPLSLALERCARKWVFRPVGHAWVRGPDLPGSLAATLPPVPQLPTQPIFLFLLKIYFYLCVRMCLSIFAMLMREPVEARRGHQISKSWSYTRLWATQCRCWEPNPGPLQEQWVPLTPKPFLQSPNSGFLFLNFLKYFNESWFQYIVFFA